MINRFALTLLEATLTLYPANADGSPRVNEAVWSGACADNLRVREQWLHRETRPTGARHPRRHPLVPQFEISIDRVWALPLSQPGGFLATHEKFVLDVVWIDEDSGRWHRQTYYGVTISERSQVSRDTDTGFSDNQVFNAEYRDEPTGGTGTPPAVGADLPYLVKWVSRDETVDLYSYNTSTHVFTALASTTSRATIANNPFTITFAGDGAPMVDLNTSGVLSAVAFIEGMPTDGDLPRLDFFRGQSRIASVSRNGRVFAHRFHQLPPRLEAGLQLEAGSVVRASLEHNIYAAGGFKAFTPAVADLPTLQFWMRAESLTGVGVNWPNVSGSGGPGLTPTVATQNGVSYPRPEGVVDGYASVAVWWLNSYFTSQDILNENELTVLCIAQNPESTFGELVTSENPGLGVNMLAEDDSLWHLYDWEISIAGNFIRSRVDGVITVDLVPSIPPNNTTKLFIGGNGGQGTLRRFRTVIAIDGVITAQQRTRLSAFLRQAYGL